MWVNMSLHSDSDPTVFALSPDVVFREEAENTNFVVFSFI